MFRNEDVMACGLNERNGALSTQEDVRLSQKMPSYAVAAPAWISRAGRCASIYAAGGCFARRGAWHAGGWQAVAWQALFPLEMEGIPIQKRTPREKVKAEPAAQINAAKAPPSRVARPSLTMDLYQRLKNAPLRQAATTGGVTNNIHIHQENRFAIRDDEDRRLVAKNAAERLVDMLKEQLYSRGEAAR